MLTEVPVIVVAPHLLLAFETASTGAPAGNAWILFFYGNLKRITRMHTQCGGFNAGGCLEAKQRTTRIINPCEIIEGHL
jgi:hypothetical protein